MCARRVIDSAPVAPILSTVLASADAVRNNGSGSDDRCGSGDGCADDAAAGSACWAEGHVNLLL